MDQENKKIIKDYDEILCTAIDTIVAQRISELKFDETIICTIVDDTQKDQGIYSVLYNDTLRFTAYAEENKKYRAGNQVYVLIPQGDYSKDKIIQGRYASDTRKDPLSYNSPLVNIKPYGTLIRYNKQLSLQANGDIKDKDFNDINDSSYESLDANNLPNFKEVKYLCVSADFSCILNDYEIKKGSYGIKIKLITNKGIYEYFLDSEQDMFGNPYAYTSYFTQEQAYVLNCEEDEILTGYSVAFYQNKDFEYYDGISYDFKTLPTSEFADIFVKNIYIYFGGDYEENSEEEIEENLEYELWDEQKVFDPNKQYIISGKIAQLLYNLIKDQKEEE